MTQREKMYLGVLMGVLTIVQHACPEVGHRYRPPLDDDVPDESDCAVEVSRYGSFETPFWYSFEYRWSYSVVRCSDRDEHGL